MSATPPVDAEGGDSKMECWVAKAMGRAKVWIRAKLPLRPIARVKPPPGPPDIVSRPASSACDDTWAGLVLPDACGKAGGWNWPLGSAEAAVVGSVAAAFAANALFSPNSKARLRV